MTDLFQRVENHIRDRRLFQRGQPVLVAVSGGLDSMTLLHLLRTLSARHRGKLVVAHFNHQLRGRSSDADERLVRTTAARMRLPFVVERADVRRFAGRAKLSLEMAARKLRHEFFVRAANRRGIRVVALAHQADDQVELFFLRLLRGAGGEGLAGMKWRAPSPADAQITLVRPLLDATRAELREFARRNKIRYREDATNARLAAPRNRIRNELLPLLRKHYQPGLGKAVLRLMELIGAESDTIGKIACEWLGGLKRSRRTPRPVPLPAGRGAGGSGNAGPGEGNDFENLPVAVQRRALQLQLADLGVPADFELIEQIRVAPGRPVSVGPHFSVRRDAAGAASVQTRRSVEFKTDELTVELASQAGEVDFSGVRFHWSLGGAKNRTHFRKRTGREFFDADKLGGRITLRHWRPGDRFQPIGAGSPVKLQDWFVNQKIPRARRHQLIVAAAASGAIFWIEGLRIGEEFKLTPQTERRLVWRWWRKKQTPGR